MTDQSRRAMLKTLAKGVAYSAPVVVSLAAPTRLLGQGPSGMMMWMICDYFPILCMIFGFSAATGTPGAPGQGGSPSPFGAPPGQAPDFGLPPGSQAPPGSRRPF